MFKLLGALNNFLGLILALVVVSLLGIGGWLGLRSYYADKWAIEETQARLADQQAQVRGLTDKLQHKQQEVDQLGKQLAESRQKVQRLETAIKLLTVDHRVAEIDVLAQQGSAEAGDLVTKFSFVEVNEQGQPLEKPRVFTVSGDLLYIDAWVVKFSDKAVESGDPLRSTSVCLFRRLFGEKQQPKEGFQLDEAGAQPVAYRSGGKPSDFERQLWERFWVYANSPAEADKAGVRAAHGEAPSIKLIPGKRYRIELRASGGLSVVPEDKPVETSGPKL